MASICTVKEAPEDDQLGVRLVLALEAAPVMHQPSSVAASGLGAGAEPSNIHQTIGVAGETQHSQRNIRLRRAPEDEQLGLLFKPSGSFIDQNLFANDSSNSNYLMISSRIVKYIVEENDGGEGFSLDGRRLYYKRRAPEYEQLGARLMLALETAPIMHQPSSVAVSGLGAGVGPSDIHQTIGVAGEAQHSQRNIRLRRAHEDKIAEYIVEENDSGESCSLDGRHLYCKRRAPKDEQLGAILVLALEVAPVMHQPSSVVASGLRAGARPSDIYQTIGPSDTHQTIGVPTNLATWTTRNSQPQLPAQPTIHLSFDCVPNTSSVIEIVRPTPPTQHPVPVSYSSESVQPFQWNAITRNARPSDIHQIIGGKRSSALLGKYPPKTAPADEQLGAGLMLSLESTPVMHQPLSVAASGLGASAGPSDTHQTIGEVGEAQYSQRTVNHQDFLPTNLATWTTRNSHPQLPAQLAIHLSFLFPKTSSVTAIVQPTPSM
ncbi:hypothetical protein GH714_030679 [Hevea brasiliensis]|uniref:Uncharacterized protein n=1 Tax=Hevea brasiliensis TaxID=3981 RepID=A0A6A6LSF8_HEVBR|nr:hypothetical protein GH714_030679 [Hevea brasiliensis]